METLILLGLILLNGVFAMSEVALLTARRGRLMKLAADGDHAAATALELGENPTRFLSTLQIGITSIGILNGIVGESVLAQPLSAKLQQFDIDAEAARYLATGLVVMVVTFVSIVVGELVPKRLGQLNPERIARRVAMPMQWLAQAARPFVRLLSFSTDTILRAIGIREQRDPGVTQEEIHALLQEGSEAGVIEQQQHDMVRNVFRLEDRKLGSLMVPRSDVVYLDLQAPLETNLERLTASEHSHFLVCDGGLRNVLGILNAKHLLPDVLRGLRPDVAAHLQPCLYVPETLTALELLEQFRVSHAHLVCVVDEYGEIEGIVTLRDLVEAVTGEFVPRNADEAWAVQRADGSWLLDGIIPLPELKDALDIRQLPEEERGRYHTLSGMLMLLLGRIPATGDFIDWEGWRFEVVDMDARRIDKVLATALPEPKRAG